MERGKNASVKRKRPPLGWWTVAAVILAILIVWVVIDRPALAERGDFDGASPIQVHRTQFTVDPVSIKPELLSGYRDFYPGQEGYDELRALLEESRCTLSPKAMVDVLKGSVGNIDTSYTIVFPSQRYIQVICGDDGWVQMDRYWIYGRAGEQFRETMDRLVPVEQEEGTEP